MKVYHGSYTVIDEIDLSKSELYRDFGGGFYVTCIYEQAMYWANRKGRIAGSKGYITEYDFIETAFEHWKFRVLRFAAYSEEWLDFVVLNRNPASPIPAHDYDIVEGPVADDKVTLRLDKYLEGSLSKGTFLEELKFFRRTHQICFCTQRSLQALEPVHKDKYAYDIDEAVTDALIQNYYMEEEKAIDLYYESQTYKMLADESTAFYQKPWTEIYEMLLRELNLK